MPETYFGGVTVYIPLINEQDYVTGGTSLRQSLINLADDDHTGHQISTAGIADASITNAKIVDGTITSAKLAAAASVAALTNDTYLTGRNLANSADLDIVKIGTNDSIIFGTDISSINISNDTFLTSRNNADSADVNLIKLDTNDDISLGAEVSVLNLKHNTNITGRNAADSANINLLKVNTSDELELSANVTTSSNLSVGNLKLDTNTLSSTDTDGDVNIVPNGTGDTVITNPSLQVSTTSITPVVKYGGTTATNATTSNSSYYIKMGDLVFLYLDFDHQKDALDSGDLTVIPTGAPTAAETTVGTGIIVRANVDAVNTDGWFLTTSISDVDTITYTVYGDGLGSTLTDAEITTTNGTIRGTYVYRTTA